MSELSQEFILNRQTAYHEAGHILVGLHLGFPITGVTIPEDSDIAAYVEWSPTEGETFPFSQKNLAEVLLMTLGGIAVEMLIYQLEITDPRLMESFTGDLIQLRSQFHQRGELSDELTVLFHVHRNMPICQQLIRQDQESVDALHAIANRIMEALVKGESKIEGHEFVNIFEIHVSKAS